LDLFMVRYLSKISHFAATPHTLSGTLICIRL